jgi:hypothetical protein
MTIELAKTSGVSPGYKAHAQAAQTIVAALAHTYPELTGEEIEKLLLAGHGALEEFDDMPAYIDGQRQTAAVLGQPSFYNTEAMRGFIAAHDAECAEQDRREAAYCEAVEYARTILRAKQDEPGYDVDAAVKRGQKAGGAEAVGSAMVMDYLVLSAGLAAPAEWRA